MTLVGSMLFGVQRNDVLSFAGGVATLLAIAAAACIVPMRRALAVDPIIAIRSD